MSTKSFIGVPALAACVCVTPALAQPSNPAGFGAVIDVGTGYPQTSYVPANGISNTQVNLYAGGGLQGGALNAGPNVEFNFLGGGIGTDEGLTVVSGTPRVNISSGTISSPINLGGGGAFWMGGGQTNQTVEMYSGGTIAIEGGVLQSGFQVYSGSTATVTGGAIGTNNGGIRALGLNTTVNMSGGTVPIQAFFANRATLNFSGGSINWLNVQGTSTANFFGTSFLLDGAPIPGLNIGQAYTILPRSGIFSGVLADGSPFSYDLAGPNQFGSSFFASNALLTATLVPTPGAALPLVAAGLLAGRRRR